MALFNLLYKFLRLGPLVLGLIAVAVLGLGFYLQIGQNERDATKAAALAAGPPALVNIVKFNRDRDVTVMDEVVVQAQPVLDFAYRLTLEKSGSDDHVFMVPLVAPTATLETAIVGIAYFPADNADFDNITPELLMAGVTGFGDVGPVTTYNGKLNGMGQWDELTEEAFVEKGLSMPFSPVIVWPYIGGRDVALAPPAPGELTVFGLFSKIAGAIALLALAKLVLRAKAEDEPVVAPAFDAVIPPAPQASAVPLWKQRSGLVDPDAVGEPAKFAPATFDFSDDNDPAKLKPLIVPQRNRLSLRKAMIGIVGLAFAVMLVSVVSGLLADSAGDQVVKVTTMQDLLAVTAADVIVPDADPNRHWTDIDVTPVVEWFVATFFLAVAGDADAQLMLGMIIGGLFFGMFMLRYFFMMRRALQPKTTARFDSMGIN